MRQERNNMSDDILNDPTDDVTKGNLSGWIEKPHISKEDLLKKDIAEIGNLTIIPKGCVIEDKDIKTK